MKLHIGHIAGGIAGLVLLMAPVVGAQTKISGSHKCAKGEIIGTVEVGDKAGHTMTLVKHTCEWTKPMEMEGGKSKDGVSVIFAEMTATRASSMGTYVGTMDNGDKFFVSFRDTGAAKGGKPGPGNGTWAFTGGTGKLLAITGKGTYTTTVNDDGTGGAEVEGEYSISSGAPKMEKKKAE